MGLIADVQYADAADGSDFSGTTRRHYRGALATLEHMGGWLGDVLHPSAGHVPPSFIAQLGRERDSILLTRVRRTPLSSCALRAPRPPRSPVQAT